MNLLTFKQGNNDGYFLLFASPGAELKNTRIIPKDVVFVLDTSGSMAGAKLEQAKKALLFCVENLNDVDRFEIMRFSTEVEPLFEKLVDADAKTRARARDFIKDLKPIGVPPLTTRSRKPSPPARTKATDPTSSSSSPTAVRPSATPRKT